jgi:hypothetical protein
MYIIFTILCGCNTEHSINNKHTQNNIPIIQYITQEQFDIFSKECYAAQMYSYPLEKLDQYELEQEDLDPLNISFFINNNGTVAGNILALESLNNICTIRAFLWQNGNYRTIRFNNSKIDKCFTDEQGCQMQIEGVTSDDCLIATYLQNGYHINRHFGLLYFDGQQYHSIEFTEQNLLTDAILNFSPYPTLAFSQNLQHILITQNIAIVSLKCQHHELYKYYGSIQAPYTAFYNRLDKKISSVNINSPYIQLSLLPKRHLYVNGCLINIFFETTIGFQHKY